MSRNQPAALDATIGSAAVVIGNQTYLHQPFGNLINGYHGQRLFVNATSDGNILTIIISSVGPDSPPPATNASSADITISYDGTQEPERWIIPSITYVGGTPIAVGMNLDQQWQNATLLVGAPLPDKPASDNATLDYIVVHEDADALHDEHYSVYWFSTLPKINPSKISSATFIPDPGGSITGPFGISTP